MLKQSDWTSSTVGPDLPREHGSFDQGAADPVEQALVAAARQGDVEAFGELFERHRSACLRRAILMLRNRGDAEDEVQNGFWKAFRRLDQYRGEGAFGAWLAKIVENQCLMRLRDQRSSRYVCLDESSDTKPGLELVGRAATPEEDLGVKEVVWLLRREVSRIPPLLRDVVILRDLHQLAMSDVAVRLGVSVPAAKSRLMRAREELRSRVSKHCGRKGPGTLIDTPQYAQMAFKRAS
jgi:RNA polymerase sigma-70 factor, ECF subfamily